MAIAQVRICRSSASAPRPSRNSRASSTSLPARAPVGRPHRRCRQPRWAHRSNPGCPSATAQATTTPRNSTDRGGRAEIDPGSDARDPVVRQFVQRQRRDQGAAQPDDQQVALFARGHRKPFPILTRYALERATQSLRRHGEGPVNDGRRPPAARLPDVSANSFAAVAWQDYGAAASLSARKRRCRDDRFGSRKVKESRKCSEGRLPRL